jgi:HAD superfamily hydrolase (TIGR01450 family)
MRREGIPMPWALGRGFGEAACRLAPPGECEVGTMVEAFLFDLDGTVYVEEGALPGAVETLAELRRRGVPFGYVTNTTCRSRRLLAQRLLSYGFEAREEEITTAVIAGAELLRQRAVRRIAAFVAEPALEDLAEFEIVGAGAGAGPGVEGTGPRACPPVVSPRGCPTERRWGGGQSGVEAVVVGDLAEGWDYERLNEAFGYLMDGAELIALSRDRYWLRGDRLVLDAGPFVAALEYASGKTAAVCGKPSPTFFQAAIRSLGDSPPPLSEIVMVGDDPWVDVEGAQRAGLKGYLVKTGKYREDLFAGSGVRPDRMLDSVADLLR